MLVTRDWLDSVSDESGLTRGQQALLNDSQTLAQIAELAHQQQERYESNRNHW